MAHKRSFSVPLPLLIAAVAASAAFAFWPFQARPLPLDNPVALIDDVAASASSAEASRAQPKPGELAGLFIKASSGRVAPSAISPVIPAPSPALPMDASSRISFIGRMSNGDGVLKYYFKDSLTGKMLKLEQGRAADGATLVEIRSDSFILTYDGKTMRVRR